MARPLRVQFEGAAYHVTARGNDRRPIYRDDGDRQRFLDTLGEAAGRHGLVVDAYCLMPNHYHLLCRTPRGNLSQAVGWLQVTYTVRFNRRHGACGHLLQGRFKAHLVDADAYAKGLVRYVHLNPVRPRDKRKPVPPGRREYLEGYRWSSHRAYAGTAGGGEAPAWLSLEWLSYWDARRDNGGGRPAALARARAAYRADVAAAFGAVVASPLADLRGGLVLGGEQLWERAKALLAGRQAAGDGDGDADVLRWARRHAMDSVRRRVAEAAAGEEDRRVRLWLRVVLGGERLADLGREFGYRDGSGVLRAVRRLDAAARADPELAATLGRLRATVERAPSALS